MFPGAMEQGQFRMGNPPWKDFERYVRNSPLSYAERVETPLMIVHGDMDFIPMQQSEEFFTALYRQGKRAELVRYWGEGHTPESTDNVRDLWHRIYAWLDEFLDISRDRQGDLMWDGNNIKSRAGTLPLKPEDFALFDAALSQLSR